MGLKSSHWCCLKACFKGYTFCFTTFLVRSSTGAQQSHERAPKKRSNELERSKFRQQVQSFVCVHAWRRVTFIFWEMLKNVSEVTLVTTNIFSLKILNFVQTLVECKVADGNCKINTINLIDLVRRCKSSKRRSNGSSRRWSETILPLAARSLPVFGTSSSISPPSSPRPPLKWRMTC